jgi:hypothetical protein
MYKLNDVMKVISLHREKMDIFDIAVEMNMHPNDIKDIISGGWFPINEV